MAAESHKELQKCQDFGGWVRKDIQYSQFQNYELTYGHFVRFPSWGHWPPGSSPGRIRTTRTSSTTSSSSPSRPSTTFHRKKKPLVTTLPSSHLLLINFILVFQIHSISCFTPPILPANPLCNAWISLDELILSLIRVKLNLFRLIQNNIRSRLLSSKWNWKISWLTTTAKQQQQQQQKISRFLKIFLFFSLAIS